MLSEICFSQTLLLLLTEQSQVVVVTRLIMVAKMIDSVKGENTEDVLDDRTVARNGISTERPF
jgi:hypothetical protein